METTQNRSCVLNKEAIHRKIKRMALQIAEQNSEEKELVIAGIEGNGALVANLIVRELKLYYKLPVSNITLKLNKKDPSHVKMEPEVDISGKTVIVTDDVANTGKTMLYALKAFLDGYPKKIQTLVLLERSHKLFPIQTDYYGLSIATTLQEHITVETENGEITEAWLF